MTGHKLPDATKAELAEVEATEEEEQEEEAKETAEVADVEPEMIKGKTDKEGYDYLPGIDWSVKKKLEE